MEQGAEKDMIISYVYDDLRKSWDGLENANKIKMQCVSYFEFCFISDRLNSNYFFFLMKHAF